MTTIDQQEGITENLTNTTKSFIFTEAKTTRYHRASGLVLPAVLINQYNGMYVAEFRKETSFSVVGESPCRTYRGIFM
jgi:hypothetical protein